MSNKDDGLSQLVQDVIDGKAEKKELCNKIYKEVYALAYPVYQNEEKSMTQAKKALIEICKRIGDFNLERNIHKQVATIASAFFFTSVVSENAEELRNNAPTGEYEYTHIKDDEEFVTYMKQKAIAFRSPKSFDQQEESFRNLSEIEIKPKLSPGLTFTSLLFFFNNNRISVGSNADNIRLIDRHLSI